MQLRKQIRKLQWTPDLLDKLDEHIAGYQRDGFIDESGEIDVADGLVHVIPSLVVIRPEKESTKDRSVFNASFCRPSLNDYLYSGPNLVLPMIQTLIWFLTHRHALTADIKKAFFQITVDRSNRNELSFLWEEKPYEEGFKIKRMRWVGVVFGVTCSPFHLAAVLHTYLDKMAAEYPTTAARMTRDLFVDDLITGADTREEGERLAREVVHIAAEVAMPLRRWRTNEADLHLN